jgi:hypothetical protein
MPRSNSTRGPFPGLASTLAFSNWGKDGLNLELRALLPGLLVRDRSSGGATVRVWGPDVRPFRALDAALTAAPEGGQALYDKLPRGLQRVRRGEHPAFEARVQAMLERIAGERDLMVDLELPDEGEPSARYASRAHPQRTQEEIERQLELSEARAVVEGRVPGLKLRTGEGGARFEYQPSPGAASVPFPALREALPAQAQALLAARLPDGLFDLLRAHPGDDPASDVLVGLVSRSSGKETLVWTAESIQHGGAEVRNPAGAPHEEIVRHLLNEVATPNEWLRLRASVPAEVSARISAPPPLESMNPPPAYDVGEFFVSIRDRMHRAGVSASAEVNRAIASFNHSEVGPQSAAWERNLLHRLESQLREEYGARGLPRRLQDFLDQLRSETG